MRLITVPLLGVMVLAGCAKAAPSDPYPPPVFLMEVGKLEAFAEILPFCIYEARDSTADIDLKAVLVAVLARELPGFSESCAHDGSTLEVQLITGYWQSADDSDPKLPRFAGGQVVRYEVHVDSPNSRWLEGIAVAQLVDRNPGEGREEAMRKAAMLLAEFLKAARATKQPQTSYP